MTNPVIRLTQQQIMGLDELHLVSCADNHRLTQATCQAFTHMVQAAAQDGISLNIASSFRDYQRQLGIWQRKWHHELPVFNLAGDALDTRRISDEDKLHGIMLWSALPGTSRHHWGTDLDVYDRQGVEQSGQPFHLVPEEYQAGGPCFELNQWLDCHLASFGFSRPYHTYTGGVAQEPWHISYQPQSDVIINDMDSQAILAQARHHQLGGLSVIESQWDSLFERYILNQGVENGH